MGVRKQSSYMHSKWFRRMIAPERTDKCVFSLCYYCREILVASAVCDFLHPPDICLPQCPRWVDWPQTLANLDLPELSCIEICYKWKSFALVSGLCLESSLWNQCPEGTTIGSKEKLIGLQPQLTQASLFPRASGNFCRVDKKFLGDYF